MKKVLVAALVTFAIQSGASAEDATLDDDMVFVPKTVTVAITGDTEVGIGEFERNQKAKLLGDVKMPVAKDCKSCGNKPISELHLKVNKKGEVVGLTNEKGEKLKLSEVPTGPKKATW